MGEGSIDRGGTSAPSPNSSAAPVQQQQTGSGQAVWSALKAAVARVGAAEILHKFSKRMLKGKSDVGVDDSKEKYFSPGIAKSAGFCWDGKRGYRIKGISLDGKI